MCPPPPPSPMDRSMWLLVTLLPPSQPPLSRSNIPDEWAFECFNVLVRLLLKSVKLFADLDR